MAVPDLKKPKPIEFNKDQQDPIAADAGMVKVGSQPKSHLGDGPVGSIRLSQATTKKV